MKRKFTVDTYLFCFSFTEYIEIYKTYTKLKKIGLEIGDFSDYVKYWNEHRGDARVHLEFDDKGLLCRNYRLDRTQDLESYYNTQETHNPLE